MKIGGVLSIRPELRPWSNHRSQRIIDLMDSVIKEIESVKDELGEEFNCVVRYDTPGGFSHFSIFLECTCNPRSRDFLVFTIKPNKRSDLWLDATVPDSDDYSHLDCLDQRVNQNAGNTHRILIRINEQLLSDHNDLIRDHIKSAFKHTKATICRKSSRSVSSLSQALRS